MYYRKMEPQVINEHDIYAKLKNMKKNSKFIKIEKNKF